MYLQLYTLEPSYGPIWGLFSVIYREKRNLYGTLQVTLQSIYVARTELPCALELQIDIYI